MCFLGKLVTNLGVAMCLGDWYVSWEGGECFGCLVCVLMRQWHVSCRAGLCLRVLICFGRLVSVLGGCFESLVSDEEVVYVL